MTYRISELIDSYKVERYSAGYSPNTIERVSLSMAMLARDMNIKNLDELTTELILEWGDLKRRGHFGRVLSQSGLYACYNSIRSFLRFLDDCRIEHKVDRKRIWCNPDYGHRKWLSAADVRKIVPYAPYDIGLLMRLLFTGGMRIGEALALTADDIRHDNTILLDHSKWCDSRTVLLTQDLAEELRLQGKDGGYLFKDRKNPDKPLGRKNAYYYIKTALIKAGYGDYYPHAKRHGYATELLRNGADISHVRRMLGHKNIGTTQLYEHLVVDDLKRTHAQYLPVV